MLDTVQALETALEVAPTAEYVIFLQDDIMVAPNLTLHLDNFLTHHDNADIGLITLFASDGHHKQPMLVANPTSTHYGAVGLVFQRRFAQKFAVFAREQFTTTPVDGLLNEFLRLEQKPLWVYHPNLIDHVGDISSLVGKKQLLRSSSFRDKGCWKRTAVLHN